MIAKFKIRVKDLLRVLRSCLSFIIPKKDNYLIFIPTQKRNEFYGNIKALLLHIDKYNKEYELALISHNPAILDEFESVDISIKATHLKISWALLRASLIFIDSNYKETSGGKYSVVQLWHGTGFKNIGKLNNNNEGERIAQFNKIYTNYKLVVATSEEDRLRKNASFGTNKSVITGSPRNDVFLSNDVDKEVKEIKGKYGLNGYSQIISYTPTFRDFETFNPFSEEFWRDLDEYLVKNKAVFIVKKHPWEKFLQIPNTFKNIKDVTNVVADVQDLLLVTDILISDYSGIITDYAITNCPIVLFTYDLDVYLKNCRTMYYDIDKILPKPFISDETELLERIKNQCWIESEEYKVNYKNFKELFHKYQDASSSLRVVNEIKRL